MEEYIVHLSNAIENNDERKIRKYLGKMQKVMNGGNCNDTCVKGKILSGTLEAKHLDTLKNFLTVSNYSDIKFQDANIVPKYADILKGYSQVRDFNIIGSEFVRLNNGERTLSKPLSSKDITAIQNTVDNNSKKK